MSASEADYDNLRAALAETLRSSIVDENDNPYPLEGIVVEILTGEDVAPAIYVGRAWTNQEARDESPDEPNLEVTGWPKGYTPPDDDDADSVTT